MKKKMKKTAGIIFMSALLLSGCGSTPAQQTGDNPAADGQNNQQEQEELTGKIAISGSTSTEKIIKALADEYSALHPGVEITYEGIGSSAGVKNAIDGGSDIGTASREIKEEEKSSGLTENIFAYDGIAIIVHPDNGVSDLTMDQIAAIYNGEITNWQEVGGQDGQIAVVSREEGSGTRSAFEELLGVEKITQNADIAEGNGNVQTTVAGNPQAIGYVSFTYIDDTIKPVKVEGVQPNVEDVLKGTYKLSRPFVMVYFDEQISDLTKNFIEFSRSDEGKAIVEEGGGIVEK